MKRQILFSVIIIMILPLVGGCAFEPKVFDVPESQWNTLTPEQRQEVIRGYNERKSIEAQIEPLSRAVGAAGRYLEGKK